MTKTPNTTAGSGPKFRFIDLFAGVGGIRLPFDELGGECVFSSEIDKFAAKTYAAYHGDQPSGDITKVDPQSIPDFDLLLAGFPCQPFSQAGKRQGFADTRGTMFWHIEAILAAKKPAVVMLENVKGFKNHDKGRTFETVMNSLRELGYTADARVLAAKDFGLPQNRERIFIIGFLDEKAAKAFSFPEPSGQAVRVGDVLEKDVDPAGKYTISDRLWAGHQRRRQEHAKKGNGFGYSMFNADSPYTNTISARYYKDGSEILIEQPGHNPRKLTPIEAARWQGFPDALVHAAHKAGVSDAQLYKQFGNSVAVNVIRSIAQKVASAAGWR